MTGKTVSKSLHGPLQKEKAPKPWYLEVRKRLFRLDLEALPPDRRSLVEEKLRELRELLEWRSGGPV